MTEILVIFLLLLLNGVFAMAEIALISARRSRLKIQAEGGKKGAERALKLGENPERFLSTVQVGITLVGVLAGAYGGSTLSPYVSPWIDQIPALAPYSERIAFVVVVVLITYFSLVIGELVPKGLALRFPEAIASAMAKPMDMLSIATRPLVAFLELSTKLVLKLFGKPPEGDEGASVADVEVILREGIVTGTVHQEESEMVEGVFDLREVLAEEVMQPRPRILFLASNALPEAYWSKVSATNQTVFPVYEDNRDSIIGLVSLRMLFANVASPRPRTLGEICVEPLFVSETQSALSLLDTLRHSKLGAALVADEFGTVRGLITLDDLVEEVVGELRPGDFQKDRPALRETAENTWLADGLVEIDMVEEAIPGFSVLTEAEKEPFQTLAGYIVHRLDRLPTEGEAFAAGEFEFEIVDMDRQRIDKVGIRRVVPGEADEDETVEEEEKTEE
ncbi:MAG: HlyC/CorC family transporter [Verrucomicrobiae bacterium]|nr:HlyC/CorC family transporter [Verrucomicrobiae bacterium]